MLKDEAAKTEATIKDIVCILPRTARQLQVKAVGAPNMDILVVCVHSFWVTATQDTGIQCMSHSACPPTHSAAGVILSDG